MVRLHLNAPRSPSPIDAHDELMSANYLLSERTVSSAHQALEVYDSILYIKQPGLISAFLNRCLCYLQLGHPELAVVDAYRAAYICNAAKSCLKKLERDEKDTLEKCRAERVASREKKEKAKMEDEDVDMEDAPSPNSSKIEQEGKLSMLEEIVAAELDYLEFEQYLVGEEQEEWILNGNHVIEDEGPLSNLLASVLHADDGPLGEKRPVMDALELKAHWRLVVSLSRCGDGAIWEAIGLIEEVHRYHQKSKKFQKFNYIEICSFKAFGDALLDEWMAFEQAEPKRAAALKATKSTMVSRVVYTWNIFEPKFEESREKADLDALIQKHTIGCTTMSIPNGTVSPYSDPYEIILAAKGDLYADEHVITDYPFVTANTQDRTESPFVCDICGCQLVLTDEDKEKFEANAKPKDSLAVDSTSYSKELDSMSSVSGILAPHLAIPADDPEPEVFPSSFRAINEPLQPRREPFAGRKAISQGFDFTCCDGCGLVLFCSMNCAYKAEALHNPLCGRNVHKIIELRQQMALLQDLKDCPEVLGDLWVPPKVTYLRQKLLLRIISHAHAHQSHPLELEEVRWLNGGLRAPLTLRCGSSYEKARTLPWSYANNVLVPLAILEGIGFQPWKDLYRHDGWVLNTLAAKIARSARITPGTRYARTYDGIGAQSGAFCPGGEALDRSVWFASIDPVVSMLQPLEEGASHTPYSAPSTPPSTTAEEPRDPSDAAPPAPSRPNIDLFDAENTSCLVRRPKRLRLPLPGIAETMGAPTGADAADEVMAGASDAELAGERNEVCIRKGERLVVSSYIGTWPKDS